MVGITTYTSLSSSRVTGSSTSATAQPVAADDKTGATTSTGSTGTSSTVSNLARQLSEAETRAAVEAVDAVVRCKPDARMHLLGFAKVDDIGQFSRYRVSSFDTTSFAT